MICIGLMSGTSMDGVDTVACDIRTKSGAPSIKIVEREKIRYPRALKERLLLLCGERGSADDVCDLNVRVGEVFAKAALKALASPALSGRRVSAIGSHGQTVRHMPVAGATLQIGDGAVIAQRTGVKTWSDFRMADMARGGQGAPLAPVIHLPLFGDRRRDVTVINIGGIANITHIPAGAKDLSSVRAFDTGPGNMLIDIAARRAGLGPYDRGGGGAAAGKVNETLVKRMLSHPYFRRRPPKSTGREEFGEAFLRWAGLEKKKLKNKNALATLTELSTVTIAREVRRLNRDGGRAIICGGGAKNGYLVNRIKSLAGDGIDVAISDKYGVPADAVEGALMALLAFYAEKGTRLDLSAITGAKGKGPLGKLSPV